MFQLLRGRGFAGDPDGAMEWLSARSLTDLRECTARFLDGSIRYHPEWGNELEAQDRPLAKRLAAINRAGLMTRSWTAGVPLANGAGQRAYLRGWIDDDDFEPFSDHLLGTDLLVLIENETVIPIGIEDHTMNVLIGAPPTPEAMIPYRRALSKEGFACLTQCTEVEVIDPRWGRDDLLWDAVLNALERRSEAPLYRHDFWS